eukprot:8666910-Pyramimonas_sp.AAC.1
MTSTPGISSHNNVLSEREHNVGKHGSVLSERENNVGKQLVRHLHGRGVQGVECGLPQHRSTWY